MKTSAAKDVDNDRDALADLGDVDAAKSKPPVGYVAYRELTVKHVSPPVDDENATPREALYFWNSTPKTLLPVMLPPVVSTTGAAAPTTKESDTGKMESGESGSARLPSARSPSLQGEVLPAVVGASTAAEDNYEDDDDDDDGGYDEQFDD